MSSLHSFDPVRRDFTPYGFTCERWMPQRMKRADRHNEIELNLLVDGAIVYLFGGRTVTIRAGELGVFWASTPHQIISYSGNTPYYVATIPLHWFLTCRLPGDMVQRLLNGEVVIEALGRRSRLDQELFRQWTDDWEQAEEARKEDLHKQVVLLEIEARLHRLALNAQSYQPSPQPNHELLSREVLSRGASSHGAFSRQSSGTEKVAQIASFIAQNYTERLTVERIAQSVELHPNYVMELFRRMLGTTLSDYINQHRVTHAQRLLVTSDESILNIAFASGFNSLSRFNAVFKAHSACTPRSYRRNHPLPKPE